MKLINQLFPVLLAAFCLSIISSSPLSAKHQPFSVGSLKTIESQFAGKAFLMILWSSDCSPCRAELELLGQLKQEYSQLNLVFVSTNAFETQSQLDNILAKHLLENTNNWAFVQADSLRLRTSIDPSWYGEMPRSYFYNAEHQRVGVSGKLTRNRILDWFKYQVGR